MFQAVKNLYAHPTYLCLGPFLKFFQWLFLGLFGKTYGNMKFGRFGVALKLEQ